MSSPFTGHDDRADLAGKVGTGDGDPLLALSNHPSTVGELVLGFDRAEGELRLEVVHDVVHVLVTAPQQVINMTYHHSFETSAAVSQDVGGVLVRHSSESKLEANSVRATPKASGCILRAVNRLLSQ